MSNARIYEVEKTVAEFVAEADLGQDIFITDRNYDHAFKANDGALRGVTMDYLLDGVGDIASYLDKHFGSTIVSSLQVENLSSGFVASDASGNLSIGSVSIDHNDTTGIQGGSAGDYFHLTQFEYNNLAVQLWATDGTDLNPINPDGVNIASGESYKIDGIPVMLPAGGSAGFVLGKNTGDDYDVVFIDPESFLLWKTNDDDIYSDTGDVKAVNNLSAGHPFTHINTETFEVNGNAVISTDSGNVSLNGSGLELEFGSYIAGFNITGLFAYLGNDQIELTSSKCRISNGTDSIILDNSISHNLQIIEGGVGTAKYGLHVTLPAITPPSYEEGAYFYNIEKKCMSSYNDRSSVQMDHGRELWTRAENDTGSTIFNGTTVVVSGWGTDFPTIRVANNTELIDAEGVIGVATEDIIDGESGEITRFGELGDIDTLGEVSGSAVYMGILGAWTTVRPLSPDYVVRLGTIGDIGENGSLLIDIVGFNDTDTDVNMTGALNGIVTQVQGVNFLVSGGVIYADVTNNDNPTKTLPFILSDKRYLLDTLGGGGAGGAARVALTPGTINNAQINFIYIELVGEVPTLKSSTTFPFVDFAWIGIVSVFDVTTTDNDGTFSWQRFNNQVDNGGGDGIFNYMMDRIRREGAVYASGIDPTITILTGPDPDSVKITTTSGSISQMHNQTYDAQDGNTYYIINHPTEPFKKISDLNEIDVYANGTSILNNHRLGLNFFANQNSIGSDDKLFVNLPENGYTTDLGAITDSSNYAITNMPDGSNTKNNTAQLYRVVVKYSTTGGGTWTNLLGPNGFQDKRAFPIGQGGGGGSSSSNSQFADAQFNIYNNVDPTKIGAFDCSGIDTGTIRTLSIPNADGVIALKVDDSHELSSHLAVNNGSEASLYNANSALIDTVAGAIILDNSGLLMPTGTGITIGATAGATGTFASPTSITVVGGIVTSIS